MKLYASGPAGWDAKGVRRACADLGADLAADPGSADAVVWVDQGADPLALAERLTAEGPSPNRTPLWVCMDRPQQDARALLAECGVERVVSPARWDDGAIATRLAAEVWAASDQGTSTLRAASPQMRAILEDLAVIAPLRDPVLVQGETGTGKELVARRLHEAGGRGSTFEPVNCAGLSAEFLRSELFGHERGAFTGAVGKKLGVLRAVGDGTVFLDEVGELDLDVQAMLLRALERGEVRPVGGEKVVPFEARVVLATNRDLRAEVAEGRFRQDLLARVDDFTVVLPPLRERMCDLLVLAEHFLAEFVKEQRRKDPDYWCDMDDALRDVLFRHDWPENVRQLRGAIRYAATFGARRDGRVAVDRLEMSLQRRRSVVRAPGSHQVSFDPLHEPWSAVERRVREAYYEALHEACAGDVDEVARRAGVSRSTVYSHLKSLRER